MNGSQRILEIVLTVNNASVTGKNTKLQSQIQIELLGILN